MGLKNVCSVKSKEISEKVEINLISFFDYGFLDKGGYFNVNIDQTGNYISNLSSLTKVVDTRGYTYWAGPKNWVYESGADSSGVNAPAQIYVNGSGYSLGTINYRDGHVYNIPSNATSVKASFSYKWLSVISAKKSGYGQNIQSDRFRPDLNTAPLQEVPETTISLPFISFDVPSISNSKPYGLGGEFSPMRNTHNVKCSVVSNNPDDVKRIADIISKQQGYTINTFDPTDVYNSGDSPLHMNGTLNGGKTHDQLANLYPLHQMLIKKIIARDAMDLGNGIYRTDLNMEIESIGCGCP